MERREFLESLGLGAAFVLTATCLNSCANNNVSDYNPVATPTGTTGTTGSTGTTTNNDLLTLDLTLAANAALNTNGGYIISKGIVVARDKNGNYVAATQTCSHEGRQQVYYDANSNSYWCTAHSAHFSLTGAGLNSTGSRGITIYTTKLDGTTLHITA